MNSENNFTPIEATNPENNMSPPLTNFTYEGKEQAISFVETTHVTDGVSCDVYTFAGDESKDLGIIRIEPDKTTPSQRVLKGERTVEGYLAGKGKLTITRSDGTQEVFIADGTSQKPIVVSVNIGETMQWRADPDSDLTAFEICSPPYEDGRFENIE